MIWYWFTLFYIWVCDSALLIFVCHLTILHPANQIGWGLLLSPIPSAAPSVSPFLSLLTFEIQWFYFDTFEWSRCPRVLKLHRTYLKLILGWCAKFRFPFVKSNPSLDNPSRKNPYFNPANQMGWELLLSPISSVGPSVSPFVSLLTFEVQCKWW